MSISRICAAAAVSVLAMCAGQTVFAEESTRAIVGATVVDLAEGRAIEGAVVLVRGERIVRVARQDSIDLSEDMDVVDLSGKWLLPGLMNMHVHLGLKLPGKPRMELADETEVELALRAAKNGRDTLLAGTTTIRDVGDPGRASIAFDQAVKRGDFIGPRIYSVGKPICPTGGHCSGLVGKDNGPVAVTESVRHEMWRGASWIKLKISGGISDQSGPIAASDMTLEEMTAAVDAAHRHGVRVTAHTGSPEATLEALQAGVDCFEHGYYLTEEVFKDMKSADAWYVPTIVVSEKGAMEFFEKIGSPDWYLQRVEAVGKVHWQALQTAIKVGVNIAMGTDQFPFEPNGGTVASVRELELYVDAGMTPIQALRTATTDAAEMLGATRDLGSIEQGKYADIIAVTSDPTVDIRALRTIGFVMKGGQVVRNDWAARGN